MINMRIDIIRKDIDRRYEEIKNFQGDFRDERDRLIINYLHVLFSEPHLKEFLLSLARFYETFISSEQFKQIKNEVMEAVSNVISEIDRVGIVDLELKKKIEGKQANFDNPFQVSGPDIVDGNLSLDQYLQGLREFAKYAEIMCTEWGLQSIEYVIKIIFENAGVKSSHCDMNMIQNSMQRIFGCKRKLIAFLRYKAEYDGASSLINLLPVYLQSEPIYLSGLEDEDFGDLVRQSVERYNISPPGVDDLDTLEDCKNLYYAVDKFLSTSKSKHALIARLITYCEWIKRESFPKSKSENWGNEREISKIVEEFMFNHGYFPLVDFKMGISIPDILSVPSANVRWDNSILMELKQSIGASYTDSKLAENITQAKQYLSTVRGAKQDIVESVYLLVFYNEDYRLEVDKSYRDECEKNNVRIELIYVGDRSPSKLTKTKILKAPKTAVKKKSPKKKAAKRVIRKK